EQQEPTGPDTVRPPATGRGQDMAGFARAEAVAGLAREVHDLSRAVATLREVPARVEQIGSRTEELGKVVGQLSEAVQALTRRPKAVPAPSWLLLPDDPQIVHRVLDELCSWLHAVFLRYPDGSAAVPECWMRHPDVVEELLW